MLNYSLFSNSVLLRTLLFANKTLQNRRVVYFVKNCVTFALLYTILLSMEIFGYLVKFKMAVVSVMLSVGTIAYFKYYIHFVLG